MSKFDRRIRAGADRSGERDWRPMSLVRRARRNGVPRARHCVHGRRQDRRHDRIEGQALTQRPVNKPGTLCPLRRHSARLDPLAFSSDGGTRIGAQKNFAMKSMHLVVMNGALGRIRTPRPRNRNPMLYPAELRVQRRHHSAATVESPPFGCLSFSPGALAPGWVSPETAAVRSRTTAFMFNPTKDPHT